MTLALSRKNLWEEMPQPARLALGFVLGRFRPEWILGRAFRASLQFVTEAQWWSAERAREYQLNSLRRICTLAWERSPYYRELFRSARFHPHDLRQAEDLRALPLLDKETVRARLSDMCTTHPASSVLDSVATGGSTGEPLHFYIGRSRSAVEYAYQVSAWSRVGYRPGQLLAVLRGRVVRPDRSGLRHEWDPLLRYHFYSSFHMNDTTMAAYLDHIRELPCCYLHVYPSTVAAFARFIRRQAAEPPRNVLGILAESEIVYPQQRRMVEEIFSCRYFSSYGMTEKVVAAAECEYSTHYHVWPTYGYFELLDGAGRPVTKPGARGEIVGTSFINDIVPFIRYRTGDLATFVAERCEACGRQQPLIAEINGHRTQETLIARDGARIPWSALNMHDDTFKQVLRFQFLQERPGQATLRIIPAAGFSSDDLARIRASFDRKMTGQVVVTPVVVQEIRPSPAGKAIYVEQRIPTDRDGEREEDR